MMTELLKNNIETAYKALKEDADNNEKLQIYNALRELGDTTLAYHDETKEELVETINMMIYDYEDDIATLTIYKDYEGVYCRMIQKITLETFKAQMYKEEHNI